MGLTKSDVIIMWLATGLIVGNLYYCQPLTILIANEFKILPSVAGQISFFTQIGYAAGLLFLFPLGDKIKRKKLLLFSTSLAVIALIIAAVSNSFIILEMALKDYTMSQIAQIMESDGAHILSASVSAASNPQRIEVTIKIDKIDISRILAGLYRYNYNVIASYNQSEHSDDLQNRYDSLMNYLSI